MESLNKFIEENDIDISHFNSKRKTIANAVEKKFLLETLIVIMFVKESTNIKSILIDGRRD